MDNIIPNGQLHPVGRKSKPKRPILTTGDKLKLLLIDQGRLLNPAEQVEHCDLCSLRIEDRHPHLINPSNRQLFCACHACAVLFSSKTGTKYKRIPERTRILSDFCLRDDLWDRLQIPVGIAFFFRSSQDKKILVYYPSPAGPIESLLPLDCWSEIVTSNPGLTNLQEDVEALLVRRNGSSHEYYRAPIDQCYGLVGTMRMHWKGFSGGTEVWNKINEFFDSLKKNQ
jgi:hypothetical protein